MLLEHGEDDLSREKEYAEVEATVVIETPAAILIDCDGSKVWVPKSVLADDSEVQVQEGAVTLRVEEWFAEKEGLG